MKQQNKKLNDLKQEKEIIKLFGPVFYFTTIYLVASIVYCTFYDINPIRERNILNNEGGIVTGTIKEINRSIITENSYTKASIFFTYEVDGKRYSSNDTNFYLDSKKPSNALEGNNTISLKDKFIAIYDTENPEKSIIRLDYPVRNSNDFREHVKEIKEKRKGKHPYWIIINKDLN